MADLHPTAVAVAARCDTRVGTGGLRGVVVVTGVFDDRVAGATTQGMLELLSHDVGEIWIDLMGVTQVTSIAVAALLSIRRRTVRAGVRLVLVCDGDEGPLDRSLAATGLRDAFTTVAQLPPDLQPPSGALAGTLHPFAAPTGRHARASVHMRRSERLSVIRADPDLADGLPEDELAIAQRDLSAPVAVVRRGLWEHDATLELGPGGLGLLVLDGLVVRRVGQAEGSGAELLGRGDILRLREHPGEDVAPWFATMLHVIQPSRIALLDEVFCERLGGHPRVMANLLARAMARSHALTVSLAVAHYPRIERRLFATFWLLAQRWGRVSPEGVHLRLPLTHAVLADLTAARRPSVTLALGQLEREGLLQRRGPEWLLLGPSPTPAPYARRRK